LRRWENQLWNWIECSRALAHTSRSTWSLLSTSTARHRHRAHICTDTHTHTWRPIRHCIP